MMTADEEGFLYPIVDKESCIDCHICEKVCPVVNQKEERIPIRVYAAINPNEEVRRKSSSGGVFTLIAEYVISQGGVVFGASFDKDWQVHHSYTDTLDGLAAFRGSKYVQSQIGDSYQMVEEFLINGRVVLFSGTPCQISGLYGYLQKKYDNLITTDVACHGVPSPLIWQTYLSSIVKKKRISHINMRDKKNGWKNFCLTMRDIKGKKIISQKFFLNPYLYGFIHNYYLRPSCYKCPVKALKSGSDFTLADYWCVESFHSNMDDNRGISAVMVNSEKAERMYNNLGILSERTKYENILLNNICLFRSVDIPKNKDQFFSLFQANKSYALQYLRRRCRASAFRKFINRIKSIKNIFSL